MRFSGTLLLALLICRGVGAQAAERAMVPDAAAQKQAEKLVKDLYKEEYAKPAPAERLKLANVLLAQSSKSADEPVIRWVLFREAREIAFQHFDFPLAFKAAEEASGRFLVEGRSLKAEGLATASKLAKSEAELASTAKAQLLLADEAAAAEDFELSEKAAASALQMARRTKNAPLVLKAQARSKEIGESKKRMESILKARDTLLEKPEDPPANLVWGIHLCFTKGDWAQGVPHLAKGTDSKLKAAAAADLLVAGEPNRGLEAGDTWWGLAQEETPGPRRNRILERARHYYEVSYAGLTGLTKIKIEKRLEDIDRAIPGPVNLLRLIDPKKDAVEGTWTMSNRGLASPEKLPAWPRLQVPYTPPAEYDLDLVLLPRVPEYGLRLILPVDGRQCMLVLGGGGGHRAGLEMIDGRSAFDANPTLCKLEAPGERVRISCKVRKDSLKVLVDGRPAIEWADFSRVSLYTAWMLPAAQSLGVAVGPGSFEVEQITLTAVSGSGKRLR